MSVDLAGDRGEIRVDRLQSLDEHLRLGSQFHERLELSPSHARYSSSVLDRDQSVHAGDGESPYN